MECDQLRASFYFWLLDNADQEPLKQLAKIANHDRRWPRQARRLHVLLRHCDGDKTTRDLVKIAHREYRRCK